MKLACKWEERRKCWLAKFLYCPQCFQKLFLLGSLKFLVKNPVVKILVVKSKDCCIFKEFTDVKWDLIEFLTKLIIEVWTCQNQKYFSRFWSLIWLTLPQTSSGFLCVCSASLLSTLWGKGEIARYEQFLLCPQCFLPIWRTFYHFHQIQICGLQTLSVWKSLRFVIWERVKIQVC